MVSILHLQTMYADYDLQMSAFNVRLHPGGQRRAPPRLCHPNSELHSVVRAKCSSLVLEVLLSTEWFAGAPCSEHHMSSLSFWRYYRGAGEILIEHGIILGSSLLSYSVVDIHDGHLPVFYRMIFYPALASTSVNILDQPTALGARFTHMMGLSISQEQSDSPFLMRGVTEHAICGKL